MSLRREVNIRKRFYDYETKRIRPPLESKAREGVDRSLVARLTPLGGLGLAKHLEYLAGGDAVLPIPKRQLQRQGLAQPQPPPPRISTIPRRRLRRAYRELLQQSPVLNAAKPTAKSDARSDTKGKPRVAFSLSKAPLALTEAQAHARQLTASELEWVQKEIPRTETRPLSRDRPSKTEI